MAKRYDINSHDAIRLLCNAVQKVHYFEKEQEGMSPACKNAGELILQDALYHLAYGDIKAARALIDCFEQWQKTGVAGWPYDGEKPTSGQG